MKLSDPPRSCIVSHCARCGTLITAEPDRGPQRASCPTCPVGMGRVRWHRYVLPGDERRRCIQELRRNADSREEMGQKTGDIVFVLRHAAKGLEDKL